MFSSHTHTVYLSQLDQVRLLHTIAALIRSEKSSDFHKILYTGADFEVDERHVIKSIKVALDRLRVQQNVFLVSEIFIQICYLLKSYTRQVCQRRYESRRSQKPYLLHLQKK